MTPIWLGHVFLGTLSFIASLVTTGYKVYLCSMIGYHYTTMKKQAIRVRNSIQTTIAYLIMTQEIQIAKINGEVLLLTVRSMNEPISQTDKYHPQTKTNPEKYILSCCNNFEDSKRSRKFMAVTSRRIFHACSWNRYHQHTIT